MIDDIELHHITAEPVGVSSFVPIPWPDGLAPSPASTAQNAPSDPLPAADVLVVTWTSAEAKALADVLCPGHPVSTWITYSRNFATEYEPHLTVRSPAHEVGGMARYWPITIGSTKVLLIKSDLHLATDDATAPVRALWGQMIGDAKPRLVITTGTAGGIDISTVEGDVSIANEAIFDCRRTFAKAPFAGKTYSSEPVDLMPSPTVLRHLLSINAGALKPVAIRPPHIFTGQAVITTDFFAFDTQSDYYGLRAFDAEARMVEMDDATLGLACAEDIADPPLWLSVRNASDPQISSSVGNLEAQSKDAESIYSRFGYETSIGSSIVTWGIIVGHNSKGTFA